MKKRLFPFIAGALIFSGSLFPAACYGQSQKAVINKYLTELPHGEISVDGKVQKYKMTAVYTNMDLYGNFTGKTKVTGDYTRGLPGDSVTWNNIYISGSNNFSEPFPAGKNQEYMENMKYIPSAKMVQEEAFKNFPSTIENIFARNLIWDMMSFEIFAWDYYDSLKLNDPYIIPDINGQFDMADIGKYSHNKIMLCWKGISEVNDELCAVVDFTAIDNKIELNMDQINTRGTEQYWGTILVSLKTKNIEQAVMYGGAIQEVEVNGMKDKFLIKTIRELEVNKIQ
ncbi:MAG TPA: hypothetical protein VMW32_02805 [Bacteroidales bacterium]|nr:hypothetical protein [Bacteroidales bacterium]